MSLCPVCSYAFPNIENIFLCFRSKICPKCGVRVKHDSGQFLLESFIILLAYNILLAFVPSEDKAIKITEYLYLTHKEIVYGFPILWIVLLLISLYFKGKIVAVKPLRQKIKQFIIYEPSFSNFKFKKTWVLPMVFLLCLWV